MIIANKGVVSKLQRLQQGQRAATVHQGDWDQAARRIHMLPGVHGVKVHLDPQAAAAEAGGYPERWHALNRGTDELAAP